MSDSDDYSDVEQSDDSDQQQQQLALQVKNDSSSLSVWQVTFLVFTAILLAPYFLPSSGDNDVTLQLSVIVELMRNQTVIMEESMKNNEELQQRLRQLAKQLQTTNDFLQSQTDYTERIATNIEIIADKLVQQQQQQQIINHLDLLMQLLANVTTKQSSTGQQHQQQQQHATTTTTTTSSTTPTTAGASADTAGKPIVGLTSLDDQLYVIRTNTASVDVYDMKTLKFERHLVVDGLREPVDITACSRTHSLYIADKYSHVVYRVTEDSGPDAIVSQWSVISAPTRLSINSAANVLVTLSTVGKIKEYTNSGKFVQEIALQKNIGSPWHAIEVSDGEYLVSHGSTTDPVHRVCMVDTDGKLFRSFGGVKGSSDKQFSSPIHMSRLVDGSVLVADLNNHRVVMLTATLNYDRTVVSVDDGLVGPFRLLYDTNRNQLLVADNSWSDGNWVSGAVKRFRLSI